MTQPQRMATYHRGVTNETGIVNWARAAASRSERRWVLMIIPRCDIDGVGEEQ